ncbi:MAG: type II toxin-antitoxin system RelE/ParE family toxin [Pyrinomonadaceae bacterium]|nr:type II toxin-antitoxin system RelE/ParE family toxin [Pyrinomonadaceae bacterium]
MSSKKVVRRRRADEDIEAAIAYYLTEAGADLATDFAYELEKAIRMISRQPSIGSSRYGLLVQLPELRHWQLKNFPYLLFYLEKETHIELTRVLHSRMDIPSWLNNRD